MRFVRFALALALAAAPLAAAGQTGADRSINAPFVNPNFEVWRGRFETEGREVYDRRYEIVAAVAAKPGQVVADVGAGSGLFVRLFAEAVRPGGRVIAVDISQVFVDNILRLAREQGLDNVSGIVGTSADTRLPEGAVDVVFTSDAYHHFEQPAATLASIRRALKPGGRFVVVDFERIRGVSPDWILKHVRAGKETVAAEVVAAGFRLAEERKLMRENYVLVFERP
jgi:predicted methyltransferase